MNDDFLRRARRPPSADFEHQLRERLREQEQNETSRRRPSWRLMAITLLLGGTALATATFLTLSRSPQPSLSATQPTLIQAAEPPPNEIQNRFITNAPTGNWNATTSAGTSTSSTPQEDALTRAATRSNARSPSESPPGAVTDTPIASTGLGSPRTVRPIRIVMTPDIKSFADDTSPTSRFGQSAVFEVDTADAALPTLCQEDNEALQPDIVVTSRPARKDEFRQCKRYRTDILQATLGHIAIVVTRAKSGVPMQLTPHTLRLALMKQVPMPYNSSQLISNPYTHWNQIDPALEERRIEIFGPSRNTPEFHVLAATLLAPACENNGSIERQTCESVRDDGVYIEARFDNTFVGQRLWADPNVIAIMDYRFFEANSADLLGSLLTGAAPTRESILDGSYVGALTLHAYVNRDRYRGRAYTLVNDYLRLPASLNQKVMLPPDGNLASGQSYNSDPKLTEVKLD